MATYADASALLRVVFEEPGPRLPLAKGPIISSQIVEVETYRAVDRLYVTGSLDDAATAHLYGELDALLGGVNLLPLSQEVIGLARAAFPVNIRALDAIHVATAQWARTAIGPIEFWTHDERQALAAYARALRVCGR